jgi:CO/xanthine dehydrogenase Mo-binding subunit
LAVLKNGRILGLKGKIIWDTGASYGYRSGNFIKGILQMPAPYKIENVHLVGLAVMTNKSYTGANRGFPQPSFVFCKRKIN